MSNDNDHNVQAQILSNEKPYKRVFQEPKPSSNRQYTKATNSNKHHSERDFNNNHVTPQSTTLNDNLEDFTDQETLPDLNHQHDQNDLIAADQVVKPDTLVTLKLIDLKILKEQRFHLLDKYKKSAVKIQK
jgi:hypothetical protein